MIKRIVLIGFSASGKSTVGKIVAEKLNIDFFDTDNMVEQSQGLTIPQIFQQFDQQYFRKLESQVVAQLPCINCVVACGGGTLTEKTADILKTDSTVVWLQVSKKVVRQRLKTKNNRPLLKNLTQTDFEKLFDSRQSIYAEFADIIVDTDNANPDEVANQILFEVEK